MPPQPISHSSSRPSSESTKTAASKDLKVPKPSRPPPTPKPWSVIHGGAFVIKSPYSPLYHNHAALLTSKANVVILSVHYRRGPEQPLSVAYEDSWEALQWAMAHANCNAHKAWLNNYVDFDRVFMGGDSAGVKPLRTTWGIGPDGAKLGGMVLFHPYFGNEKRNKLFEVIFPACSGPNDLRVNLDKDPKLGDIGFGRVLVFVAKKDFPRERAERPEIEGEDHVFHLFNPSCDRAWVCFEISMSS